LAAQAATEAMAEMPVLVVRGEPAEVVVEDLS
jgi:hypothetical protein